MCRHVAWLGEPRSLASLILDPPHALLVQSYAPSRQRHGRINGDGWGVGFYGSNGSGAQPGRWRSTRPLWSEASFASVAPLVSASCVLAAVRSASAGMPIDETATAPFAYGPWLLSHNGIVDRAVLPADLTAESVCDSALLAAHVFARGPQELGATVAEIGMRDPNARLNLLATNGSSLIATTWGDTLSILTEPNGVALASEPYDDDVRWVDVPDRHLVEVTSAEVIIRPLENHI
jgi:gamma-glutamyl hercynylcysteine S-oxide hydrolase